jgi:hypothetical protein
MSGAPSTFDHSFSVAGMATHLVIDGLPAEKQALLKNWYSAFQVQAGDLTAGQIQA